MLLVACDSQDPPANSTDTTKYTTESPHEEKAENKPHQNVLLALVPVRGGGASSYLMSPHFRYAAFTQPPGPLLRADAEFLGTTSQTDRWRLTISPENGEKVIKEVEYKGEPIIVWSKGGQHVVLVKDEFTLFELRKSGQLGEEQKNGTR